MKYLEIEINKIKDIILNGFIDPFEKADISSFLVENSKFIRSKLVLLYLKSQNLVIKDDIYTVLAVGELIHNASLLHDDVIDDANERRGFSPISKRFNSKISILAGDYVLSFAIEKLLTLHSLEFLDIFKSCTQKMSFAEFKQYFLRGKQTNLQDYIDICKGKTAELFIAVFKSCALIQKIDIEKASNFADLFGICFQINNDLSLKSLEQDRYNKIATAIDILGIEKTHNLLDNYKEELRIILSDFPDNIYKQGLEDLINNL